MHLGLVDDLFDGQVSNVEELVLLDFQLGFLVREQVDHRLLVYLKHRA